MLLDVAFSVLAETYCSEFESHVNHTILSKQNIAKLNQVKFSKYK